MILRSAPTGSAAGLIPRTLSLAKQSFSFFVRACLGHRRLPEAKLEALACGDVEPSEFEASLLAAWQELRSGRIPAQLRWLQ